MEKVRVGASYFRFGRKYHPLVCPKNSRITMKPLVLSGRKIPWPDETEPIGVTREPDKLKGFTIILEGFKDYPKDGIFEFWTKHWEDDEQDSEFPWIKWQFHNVTWKGFFGNCSLDYAVKENKNFDNVTGWRYAKKVPRL